MHPSGVPSATSKLAESTTRLHQAFTSYKGIMSQVDAASTHPTEYFKVWQSYVETYESLVKRSNTYAMELSVTINTYTRLLTHHGPLAGSSPAVRQDLADEYQSLQTRLDATPGFDASPELNTLRAAVRDMRHKLFASAPAPAERRRAVLLRKLRAIRHPRKPPSAVPTSPVTGSSPTIVHKLSRETQKPNLIPKRLKSKFASNPKSAVADGQQSTRANKDPGSAAEPRPRTNSSSQATIGSTETTTPPDATIRPQSASRDDVSQHNLSSSLPDAADRPPSCDPNGPPDSESHELPGLEAVVVELNAIEEGIIEIESLLETQVALFRDCFQVSTELQATLSEAMTIPNAAVNFKIASRPADGGHAPPASSANVWKDAAEALERYAKAMKF